MVALLVPLKAAQMVDLTGERTAVLKVFQMGGLSAAPKAPWMVDSTADKKVSEKVA